MKGSVTMYFETEEAYKSLLRDLEDSTEHLGDEDFAYKIEIEVESE